MSRELHHINTIHQYHKVRGLSKPLHPLISIVDYSQLKVFKEDNLKSWTYNFYTIALKRNFESAIKMNYGQQEYDYDEGVMFFMAPGQLFSFDVNEETSHEKSGWMILIHPDFLLGTTLAKAIRKYDFFSYATHEALFLSEKEEQLLNTITANLETEYQSVIDKHSQQIIVTQLETLLAYSSRFYERQFATRIPMSHHILERFEEIINAYFKDEKYIEQGLPSVKNIADQLCLTPTYLSSLLRHLTGQTTQQHIHDKLITIAKQKLSTTDLSISQIAYELGFDYPQSFSNLFKKKTNQSPIKFRQLFN
ncbi:AraC family transcriptional regulator [Leeuwenhoekiella aestuarii]|uniref:AraC family transcriptional regulator n=1 Tax=Leeuwenhoekiella aestuarii TaxID=2249426 RepID=A0A4Q0NNE1_9FLAO|nr:response regulator transcription factor [Leeuwenhoekiella aestuarii]RXG11425.1 AraC family transcriptional regulator [Leeuwenhoekiella aestuarii]RXG12162.1 AraC family transcriptional regulator [Leeuwenhoekiella aestuarii]